MCANFADRYGPLLSTDFFEDPIFLLDKAMEKIYIRIGEDKRMKLRLDLPLEKYKNKILFMVNATIKVGGNFWYKSFRMALMPASLGRLKINGEVPIWMIIAMFFG